MTAGDEECEACVKELDVDALTNPFALLINPDAWNKTDYFISELLVDAAVSLKALTGGKEAERYKMKVFCKAQRLFDSVSFTKTKIVRFCVKILFTVRKRNSPSRRSNRPQPPTHQHHHPLTTHQHQQQNRKSSNCQRNQ